MAPAAVELDTLDSSRHSQDAANTESDPRATHDESTLPPVDSGKAAWLFLAACWAVEAFVFGKYLSVCFHAFPKLIQSLVGFGFSFGVFQDFYTTHEPFAGSGDIAVIGTTTLVSELPRIHLLLWKTQQYHREPSTWEHLLFSCFAAYCPAGPAGLRFWVSSPLLYPWQ